MKKKVFRERQAEQDNLIQLQNFVMEKTHDKIIEAIETIEAVKKEPKKRGRKKSDKSSK